MATLRPRRPCPVTGGFRFASTLPVASMRDMLPFVVHALRIKRSLDRSIGDVGGVCDDRLVADARTRTFTVESTWTDEAACRDWVGGTTHVAAMRALADRVDGRATFVSEHLDETITAATTA